VLLQPASTSDRLDPISAMTLRCPACQTFAASKKPSTTITASFPECLAQKERFLTLNGYGLFVLPVAALVF
jgi:hypothetical protein